MSHQLRGGHVPDKHGGGDRQNRAQSLQQSTDSTRKKGAPCRHRAAAPHSLGRVNQCAPLADGRRQPSMDHPGGW
jgi:hypothetical protein